MAPDVPVVSDAVLSGPDDEYLEAKTINLIGGQKNVKEN